MTLQIYVTCQVGLSKYKFISLNIIYINIFFKLFNFPAEYYENKMKAIKSQLQCDPLYGFLIIYPRHLLHILEVKILFIIKILYIIFNLFVDVEGILVCVRIRINNAEIDIR